MRIGIIAEGAEDQSVISNILRAYGINGSDISFIKPNLQRDLTDENSPDDPTTGGLQGVKNACIGFNGARPYFDQFFLFDDNQFVVVHLDTAEIDDKQDFTFSRPLKLKKANANYCSEMRKLVIELVDGWLENNYQNQVLYAIAIEEIEAWCLTLYIKSDTSQSADAKTKFWREVNKKKIKNASNLAELTQDFRKLKTLKTCFPYNQSLKDFADSVELATQAFNP